MAHFTVENVDDSYPARFVRKVGLEPLAGSVPLERVPAATLDVVRRWRARVWRLAEWRLPPACAVAGAAKARKWPMLNCVPAFARCGAGPGPPRACNVPTLCPFCWSRQALELWRRVDASLFGAAAPAAAALSAADLAGMGATRRGLAFDDDRDEAPAGRACRDDLALITRSITYTLPDAPGNMRPSQLIAYRLSRGVAVAGKARTRRPTGGVPGRHGELDRFRRLGIVGGVDAIAVALSRAAASGDGDGAAPAARRSFRVEFRQAMFCPAARVAEVIANPLLCAAPAASIAVATPRVEAKAAPSRLDVLDAVAWVRRYPRLLLEGDLGATKAVLVTRRDRGRRLVTTFGRLYGRHATTMLPEMPINEEAT